MKLFKRKVKSVSVSTSPYIEYPTLNHLDKYRSELNSTGIYYGKIEVNESTYLKILNQSNEICVYRFEPAEYYDLLYTKKPFILAGTGFSICINNNLLDYQYNHIELLQISRDIKIKKILS